MKWFGMKAAAGEAGRPVLARAWGSGAVALGEWPASYEAQLRAGVIGNPVAQRAMRLVSEGAGACALKVGGARPDRDAGEPCAAAWQSNTSRWNGSTGSTTGACWSRPETFHRLKPSNATTLSWTTSHWLPNLRKLASGNPGTCVDASQIAR